jgi:Predicted phosphohydrolase (DHH superfamily)
MDDKLINSAHLSLSRKSRLPGAGFFYPDSTDDDDEDTHETVATADVVVIADADADGLGCVALLREMYDATIAWDEFEPVVADRLTRWERGTDTSSRETHDTDEMSDISNGDVPSDAVETETNSEVEDVDVDADADADADADEHLDADVDADDSEDTTPTPSAESDVALITASPYSIDDALSTVATEAPTGVDVYICDLCPDEFNWIESELTTVADRAETVAWYDHHQWDSSTADAVRECGVELVIGESDEECSTDVTLRSLPYEFGSRWTELATVTRDHDLWIKEDARSDDLADYAYWAPPEEYATVVGTHGVDLPTLASEYLALRRVEKDALIDAAVDRAELTTVGPWTVGITYGRCSQNEVAETLRSQGADAAVVVKPAGSASIRGSETFERSHEVAGQLNGGGHPRAADVSQISMMICSIMHITGRQKDQQQKM